MCERNKGEGTTAGGFMHDMNEKERAIKMIPAALVEVPQVVLLASQQVLLAARTKESEQRFEESSSNAHLIYI